MSRGSITLGDVAEHTTVLAVACSRCERAGRYNLDTLIARHGEGFGIPKLLRLLSKECVKGRALLRVNPSTSSRCCKSVGHRTEGGLNDS